MNLANRYQTDSEVTFQKLEDATVIVHLGTGRIHHTNETGSRIWDLLERGRSLAEILETLVPEFEAPPDQLRRELVEFVEQLSNEKLIFPIGDQAG